MTIFLALQNTYHLIEVAVCNEDSIIESVTIDKVHASKELLPIINKLLMRHNFTLQSLSFLTINQGPGPFTTLRVVITTANGISFATGLPLIGVDGLIA